jgi:DNA-binding NtrC family response regulator
MAESLLRDSLTPSDKVSCYELIARVALSIGQTEAGLKAMRTAFAAAAEAQSPRLQARLIFSNAEALLHWVAIEPAVEEIPKLRRACLAAGDPYSMIAFHKLLAEVKSKKGLAAAALSDIKAARTLLNTWPNVWQQGRLAVVTSAIEFLNSNYDAALKSAAEALACADRCGSHEIRIPALGNLANIKLAQGNLVDAQHAIEEFLAITRKGGTAEICGLDTQMEIALAADDLDRAQSLDDKIAAVSAHLDNGNSYHGLWNLLTRVRLLYRLGKIEAGLAMASEALQRIERMADRNVLERMQLLAAEGLGRTGKSLQAASLMATAVNSNPDPTLEIIGEVSRVAGRITAREHADVAYEHYQRAFRIFERIGNVAACARVRRDATETLTQSSLALGFQTSESSVPSVLRASTIAQISQSSIAERIVGLLELGAHPPLLGAEALELIIDSGSVSSASLVESSSDAPTKRLVLSVYGENRECDTETELVTIDLGEYQSKQYSITVKPNRSATARTTILAIERLLHAATTIALRRREHREQAAFWPEHSTEQQELGLLAGSEKTSELVKTIRRVAPSNLTILITGETGVGKELFARALHLASPRKDRTFLPFNCATVPKDMIDSQLFGHRRGAFTGAHEAGPGVIRAAAGGTLFLDEIGEMSMDAQPKLLRFLESGEIHPLGEPRPQQVDVRIVTATNKNLDQLVSEGRFREDLYYRLNVLPIHIPPLRDRREEIPALVEHFLECYGREMQKPLLRVADETLEYLLLYRWPGNVRQLANELRRIVALAEPGTVVMPAHLSKDIIASRRTIPVQPSEVVIGLDQPLQQATDDLERAAIERALTATKGNNDEAAKALGLSRKGLYLKRQRLGLK